MSDMSWYYEDEPLNGGAGGEVFRSVFNGSGADAATRLAREAIQNSVDASLPGEVARVSIKMKSYSGESLGRVWSAAGLDDLKIRATELGLYTGNVFDGTVDTLRVLHVVDSQTTGLSGDPTAASSKLRKLLMEIGGSQKMDEGSGTGGSYGFGKAVYSASSRIAVIFAYSRTTDAKGEPISLLMGCSYHKAHTFDGKPTTGRGFFAKPKQLENGIRYDAFQGDEADRLAESLDMERSVGDMGTTIAVFDCPLEMDDIRRGVEKSWWPKIIRDNFKVKLFNEEGAQLHARPLRDPEVKPFIEAMKVAMGVSPAVSGKSFQKKSFQRVEGKDLGSLGLFVMPERAETGEEDEIEDDMRDTIALVRSPGMVVQHYGKRQVNHPPVAGVFLASDEVDDILRRSEPPEHDRWDPKADRLNPAEQEKDVVEAIYKRSWHELRGFQRRARPPEPAVGSSFAQLERELSRLFGPSGKRSPVGKGSSATPISLQPTVEVEEAANGLRVRGNVVIQLKADHDGDLDVHVDLDLTAVDEAGRHADKVPLKAEFGNDRSERLQDGGWKLRLSPGEKVKIEVESEDYDRGWTVDFVPRIKPMAEEFA